MKLLWLCNMAPGIAREEKGKGGLWMDHVLADLRKRGDLTIRILFPGKEGQQGSPDENCSFASFASKLPHQYIPELENRFREELIAFQPDVIHIWGTEYSHTLAMVNACEALDLLDRTAVSIQGLCSVIARHYAEGIPYSVQLKFTFRDFLRQDNILQQQKKFTLRGENEVKALQKVRHVIGRTHWDRACTEQVNPNAVYHFCNETLRDPFYQAEWRYENCQKHRIFASSCEYPVKGFHYLLEAFGEVVKAYPDAMLAVPGRSFFAKTAKEKLRQSSYQTYLAELAHRYQLEDKIEFLGSLNAEQMRDSYLSANVFVLPSTIENSPNSMGEAMLLGVPCVASDVGGVSSMMKHEREGLIYQSTAPYVLAYDIKQLFAMGEDAGTIGAEAKAHAMVTHDPDRNLNALLNIYQSLQGR